MATTQDRYHARARRRGALLAVATGLVVALAAGNAAADDADIARIKSAVQFSLQCNASLGTIEDVEVTATTPGGAGALTVRGTYRQKIGSFGKFGFQAPEASGGVFEGVYQLDRKAFKELQFKISLRSGRIPDSCLR